LGIKKASWLDWLVVVKDIYIYSMSSMIDKYLLAIK